MKHYDRKKKKWVDGEAPDTKKSPRDKDICRGQKPHDFVLVLPDHVTYTNTYNFNAQAYYDILDEIDDFEIKAHQRMQELGIQSKYSSFRYRRMRLYMCSVCKKRHYEHPDD